ncbi:MAG: translation initiation factor IF-3 [Akkermansia sp.]
MPLKKPNHNNKDNNRRRERGDQTRVNERIRAPRVRVVTSTGEQLGVMNTRDALDKAKSVGLDLVEVASSADPPVCRIVDYGRYKYQQSKLQKNNKSKIIRMKEVKLRIGTDTNDYNVKMARSESFLDNGHKVRFLLRFRGRENAHQELGYGMMQRVVDDMKTMGQIDQIARLAGNTMNMVLSPLPEAQRIKKFRAHLDEGFDSESDEFDAKGTPESAEFDDKTSSTDED